METKHIKAPRFRKGLFDWRKRLVNFSTFILHLRFMKKTLTAFTLLIIAGHTFAQTHADIDDAVARFQIFYNKQQTDSIFNMLSERAKGLMPLDKTKQTFTQLHTQLGDLNSYYFTKESKGHSYYKTIFKNATLSLIVSLTPENKLETFRFIPYKEDTTPVEHEISNFVLKTATGNIYGTLAMPPGENRKVPVVLIIAGSGPTDRNGNSNIGGLKCNAYKMLADSLLLAGIASIRYDKRGVGESAGAMITEDSMRFEDIVNDAAGFIKMLKEDSRFSKIIVLGHSEGSLVGMIAARKEKTAGYISLAGIAERADKVIEKQIKAQSEELAEKATTILDSLDKGYFVKDVDASLFSLFRPSVQPYMISWLKYEPKQEIKKLTVPILILQGTTDIQVGVEEAGQLKKACPKATFKLITGMNHALKQATDNYAQNAATYTKPDLPLSPELVPAIVKFVKGPLPASPNER